MSPLPASVLDASALLAYLLLEPGAEKVRQALEHTAAISAVNLAEVLSKLSDFGLDPDEAADRLARLGLIGAVLHVVPLDENHARQVARLRGRTKGSGLGLADRACLALGMLRKLPVYTADRRWRSLELSLDVRLIR